MKVPPLEIVADIAVTAGFGLIVTFSVNAVPEQAPLTGVTVYVAVCIELVVLVSVPPIEAPLPGAPPAKPDPVGAAQLYVVPAGTMPSVTLAGMSVKLSPLHIMAFMVFITGAGFTVTVTVKAGPVQLPDKGVTV